MNVMQHERTFHYYRPAGGILAIPLQRLPDLSLQRS